MRFGLAVGMALVAFGAFCGNFGEPPKGWEGLSVAVLGDSITDKHQAHEIYWQYLAAWLKWDVHGYGISGQRWPEMP